MSRNLVTVAPLAEHFGVSRQTVHSWTKRGMPCYKREGVHTRYSVAECEEWLMGASTTKPVEVEKAQKPTKEKKVSKVTFDEMHMGMAEYFVERIRSFLPTFKQPNMQRWANDFRMMNKIDKRSQEEIGAMIKFVTAHHFWHRNCMSPSTMREKWDRLQVEMNNQAEKGGKQNGQRIPQRSEQDSIARGVIGHLNPNAHIIDVSDDELPNL